MKAQAKSSLIIIVTLLIGMVLGGLISGALRGNFHGRAPGGGEGKGRLEMMLKRVVQPDETQQVEFDRILARYSPKFMDQHKQHTVEMKTLIDSLIEDLTPILTEEQLTTLTKKMTRMARGFRGRGKRGGGPRPAGDN